MSASLHRPAGSLATADLAVSLTAADAGWSFAGPHRRFVGARSRALYRFGRE